MLNTIRGTRGMAVAAASTIAVAYPHMNGIGGDAFWLIVPDGQPPIAIDACGPAARAATIDAYRGKDLAAIPTRGPLAANTVAGTVAGWRKALDVAARLGGRMRLARLLDDAIAYAEGGVPATASQASNTRNKLA